MSRSKRKTPICGITTAETEKTEQAAWHRRHRHAEKVRINAQGIEYVGLSHKEHSDPWSMSKDGKKYWTTLRPDLMRK